MADIFISYARSSEATARQVAARLRALGHTVWRDDELPAHRAYAEVIEERLRAARAVVVLWCSQAVRSQWVRAEANVAREAGTLVQLRVEAVTPPLPFNEIQCAELVGWNGEDETPGWAKVVASIAALLGPARTSAPTALMPDLPVQPLLAVMPFDNLSGDPEMRYFSDGVSEEILHTVARAKGLRVIGKASSFQFRGEEKTTRRVVNELSATHMLDGSVRRAGDQVRISAQLVDTATHMTLWSERYDRALTDIFALQDEIAAAIAAALDTHFTPGPAKGAIDPQAYDLFLQARAIYAQDSTDADRERCVRLLEQTVARAPDFALAWGQLAMFRGFSLPKTSDAEGDMHRPVARSEAERALSLDPECGPAFTALALLTPAFGDYGEKLRLSQRGYDLTTNDTSVAHCFVGALMSVGRNREACAFFDDIVKREPSSPYSRAVQAYFHNSAGNIEQSLAMAEDVVRSFPTSLYARFMLDRISRSAESLQRLPDPARRDETMARLQRRFLSTAPVVYLVHAGRAARFGEVDLAYETLLTALDEGRPVAFDETDAGRGFSRSFSSVGLFSLASRALRQDARFAELCVRLGLYDHWQETGQWPDCAEEVTPFYDFQTELAAAETRLGKAGRYAEQPPTARQQATVR